MVRPKKNPDTADLFGQLTTEWTRHLAGTLALTDVIFTFLDDAGIKDGLNKMRTNFAEWFMTAIGAKKMALTDKKGKRHYFIVRDDEFAIERVENDDEDDYETTDAS